MPPNTVPTRIMIISDTHEHSFDGTTMPPTDILIHASDLTNFGSLDALRESVRIIGTIKAELKLVIAGNHDRKLDETPRVENISDEEYAEIHEAAVEIMTGPLAKEADVTYLEEGNHSFTLTNGAKFTIYASPYPPGFWQLGFLLPSKHRPLQKHQTHLLHYLYRDNPNPRPNALNPRPCRLPASRLPPPPPRPQPRSPPPTLLRTYPRRLWSSYRNMDGRRERKGSAVRDALGDGAS